MGGAAKLANTSSTNSNYDVTEFPDLRPQTLVPSGDKTVWRRSEKETGKWALVPSLHRWYDILTKVQGSHSLPRVFHLWLRSRKKPGVVQHQQRITQVLPGPTAAGDAPAVKEITGKLTKYVVHE